MASSDAQGDTLRFQRVYEHTPHILPSSILDPAFDISRITVTDLFGDGSAIILENLLTAEECSALKQTGEKFGLQNCGYSSTIRVCDRVSAMGHEFAAELFRRALPFVSEVVKVKAGSRPRGVDDGLRVGEYKPIGLNPCFRVVRYHPGGFFFPHYDYGFEESASITSVKTFMMYLSGAEDFEGGPTRFFNEKQKHYVKPVKSNIVHSYAPLPGSCLIFNHHITHDGGNVLAGQKWLFRTELMYECELTEDQKIEDAFKQLVANVSDTEDSSQKYEY